MRLRFTPRALDNLADIANYIGSRNPAAAERVKAAIHASLQNVAVFPNSGQQVTNGVRRIVTRHYPYLVYYYVDENAGEVVVLNVKHPAREREFDDG